MTVSVLLSDKRIRTWKMFLILLLLKGKNDPLPKKTVNIEQVAFGICKICLTSPTNKKSNYPLIYNKLKMMLFIPLEQFQIILLFSIKLFCFDFSITNLVLVNFLVLLIFMLIASFFSSNENYLEKINLVFIFGFVVFNN